MKDTETLLTFEEARAYIQQYAELDMNTVNDFLNDIRANRRRGWRRLFSKETIDEYFFAVDRKR